MRELALRIAAGAVEDVLDVLLPLAPNGVHEVACGNAVELRLRGSELPEAGTIERLVGVPVRCRELPGDWAAVCRSDRELVRIGRIAVRAEWMPPPAARTIDVVLGGGEAFGSGDHPTTRMCLELLDRLSPQGAFADLGCGSGVLAAAAAGLGWAPVHAVDVVPAAVEAARRTARASGVAVTVAACDLFAGPLPEAAAAAANVPDHLHDALARRATAPVLVVSGFQSSAAEAVLAAYVDAGYAVHERLDERGWAAARLGRRQA
jgi:ribosomal protein L11 methyltransferase